MQVEEILAPMRAELSRIDAIDSLRDARYTHEMYLRWCDLRLALRINEEFVRSALRAKESAS